MELLQQFIFLGNECFGLGCAFPAPFQGDCLLLKDLLWGWMCLWGNPIPSHLIPSSQERGRDSTPQGGREGRREGKQPPLIGG